jgi:hypothetical protein
MSQWNRGNEQRCSLDLPYCGVTTHVDVRNRVMNEDDRSAWLCFVPYPGLQHMSCSRIAICNITWLTTWNTARITG